MWGRDAKFTERSRGGSQRSVAFWIVRGGLTKEVAERIGYRVIQQLFIRSHVATVSLADWKDQGQNRGSITKDSPGENERKH